jgi:hypothetical protein
VSTAKFKQFPHNQNISHYLIHLLRFFCWAIRNDDPNCTSAIETYAGDNQVEIVSLDLLAALLQPLRT